jgi:hypothetical protein
MEPDTHSMPDVVADAPGGEPGKKVEILFHRLLSRYLSRVEMAPRYENAIAELARGGVVIYALKYPAA